MKFNSTRLPLAIAMASALAFAAGCSNSTEDRTAMEPVDEAPAAIAQPAETAPLDPTMQGADPAYSADASQHDVPVGNGSDQPLGDTWITTKVKSSLMADINVSGLDINVETVNGVVTLSGLVDQPSQIDQATQIARGIEGVTDVRATELVTR